MARYVKIATISLNQRPYIEKSSQQSIVEFEQEWLEKNIDQVLPDKPDLIVLPECADKPESIPLEDLHKYYHDRGDKILHFLKRKAKDNHCYICYGTHRFLSDKTGRNSAVMIDRAGNVVGIYDKNYIVPRETTLHNIVNGESEKVIQCDFGKVGVIICFDLNFNELRERYKLQKPDIMLFLSNFGGGLMRNFYAFDTRSYFVSSCAYGCNSEIINPLGVSIAKTSNHYNYVIRKINLDYQIVHLDNNWDKIRSMKNKYGEAIEINDIGYIGVVMITNNSFHHTICEMLEEFQIKSADEYFQYAFSHRNNILKSK